MKTSGAKIGRAYIITIVCCLCMTAFACGYAVTDSNTKSVSNGFGASVAAAVQTDEKLTLSVADKEIEIALPQNIMKVAKMLPAPLGCVIAIAESAYELADSYF